MLRILLIAIVWSSTALAQSPNFLYEQDKKSLNTAVSVIVKSGSMHDPAGKAGLARMSFLALLRGTKLKNRTDLIKSIETLGANIEVSTSSNRSVISLNVINENLAPAMALLQEILTQPALPQDDLDNLKEEELGKLNQEISSNRLQLRRAARLTLFKDTPLAYPAEGTIASVEKIGREDIRSFLFAHIHRANVVVAANSNLPEKEMRSMAEKLIAALPEGEAQREPSVQFPALQGRTLYIVPKTGAATNEMMLIQPGIRSDEKEREELELANFILGEDMTSRLFDALRNKTGWTYGVASSYRSMDLLKKHRGIFVVYSFPRSEFTEKLAPKAVELYEEYIKKGLTDKEIQFAKNFLTNSYAFRFATASDRLQNKLLNQLDGAPLLSMNAYQTKINGLTKAAILRALQKHHQPQNFNLVVVGDPNELKKLATLIPGIKSTVIIPDPMSELGWK